MTTVAKLAFSWLVLLLALADGWLGVYLDNESDKPKVVEVVPDSPAANAGIKVGDLLLSVDDTATADREAFVNAIRACKKGQRVRLKLERGGKEMTVVVRLGERPADAQMPAAIDPAPVAPKTEGGAPTAEAKPAPAKLAPVHPAGAPARPFLGVQLEDADGAVRIVRVVADSPAAAAGLAEGDRIVKWGDLGIGSLAQIEELLGKAKAGDEIALQVTNDHGTRSVAVRLAPRAGERVESTATGRAPQPVEPPAAVEAKPAPQSATNESPAPGQRAPRARAARSPFGKDFDAALEQAEQQHKRVLVFYFAGSDGGGRAQRRVFADPSVSSLLGEFVCVEVDAEQNEELVQQRDIRELPAVEILRGGKTERRQAGLLAAERLQQFLRGENEPAAAPAPRRPATAPRAELRTDSAPAPAPAANGEDAALQQELARLRAEVAELRKLVEQLKRSAGGGRE